jgi:uncharacterized protein DUF3850
VGGLAVVTRHRIRSAPGGFAAVLDGRKAYVVLPRSRVVQVGDVIDLIEVEDGRETGSSVTLSVSYRSHYDDPPACVVSVRVWSYCLAGSTVPALTTTWAASA